MSRHVTALLVNGKGRLAHLVIPTSIPLRTQGKESTIHQLLGEILRVYSSRSILGATKYTLLVLLCLATLGVNAHATTYYIAANGSDANSGLTKLLPWAHAPGMPYCASVCAAKTAIANGDQFIFKGGDTWHFGNSGASPYTGGAWQIPWPTNYTDNTCVFGSTATCAYWGVDATWFTGGSWTRPIMTGDNATSTSVVASCTYTSPGTAGPFPGMITPATGSIFDNFEITGFCVDTASNFALFPYGSGNTTNFITNVYIHGWTVTTANFAQSFLACALIGGNSNSLVVGHNNVIDGSDSKQNSCAWGTFPSLFHFYANYIGHTTQGVGQFCHDIHDNIFEFFDNPLTDTSTPKTHGNILECNINATGNQPGNPANTPNVFYNNVVRHATNNFSIAGQVGIWLAPRGATDEYWFNNIDYDTGNNGNFWAVCWQKTGNTVLDSACASPGDTLAYTGKVYMFGNTLVDGTQPCPLTSASTVMDVYNAHLVNTTTTTTGYTCPTIGDSSNVTQSDAQATSQGYGTTSGATNTTNAGTLTAASEATPFAPTINTNITVSGTPAVNKQAYCTALAAYTQEAAISTDAYLACKNGTSAAVSYNNTTHTVTSPAQTLVARPVATAWNSGAWQFSVSPGPTITTFSGSPLVIKSGTSTTITIATSNATVCSIDQGIGPVTCNGTVSLSPTTLTTYTLSASGTGGSATPATASVTIGGTMQGSNTIRTANTIFQ